jgi:hypothetical protein
LVAFEPLTGQRLVEICQQRTKAGYRRLQQRGAAMCRRPSSAGGFLILGLPAD